MGATMFGATSIKAAEQPGNRRRDNLAIVYQNLLTVIVRLRGNRQVINDAQAFRVQMQSALRAAEKEGIGKRLVQLTKEAIGNKCMLLLLAAPSAMEYYPKIGMETVTNGFIIKRES